MLFVAGLLAAAHRKMQVNEAAVEEALQGGGISRKERALLNRLRDTLGLSMVDADALERDLQVRDDGRRYCLTGAP